MGLDALLGNEQLKENLRQSLRKGQISHFYLISGPEGSGKRTLCKLLAMGILCAGGEKPCGHCGSCRKLLTGNHPDCITVDDPEKKTVPVDLIREARGDMYVRPNESDHKIYIFPRAQDMGIPGQNALLKILEEPPSYGVFILLTDNPEKLLPTVRSRCTELRMQPLSPEIARMELARRFPEHSPEELQAAITRGGGYLGQAAAILEQGSDLPEQTVLVMESIAKKDAMGIAQALCSMEKWKREQSLEIFRQWTQLLQEALSGQNGQKCTLTLTNNIALKRTGSDILRYILCLQKAVEYAGANVSCATICGYLTWALQ